MPSDQNTPTIDRASGAPLGATIFQYELGADESPSDALASVLTIIADAEPTQIEPLGYHLDLEALDLLLSHTSDGSSRIGCSVVLTVKDYVLTLDGESIVIRQNDD